MALNLTSARIAETCFGLYCIASFLCFGIIKCAPTGLTATLSSSSFNPPTTDVEEGVITVDCGSSDGPPSTTTFLPDNITKTFSLDILTRITDVLNSDISTTFDEYKEVRYDSADVGLRPISNLPNINSVSNSSLDSADRMATHFYIIKGFHTAMSAVIKDENDNNTSRKFVTEFQTIESKLGIIMGRLQGLICMVPELHDGVSRVGEPKDLGFKKNARTPQRVHRDYTVLYHLHQYITKFYHDLYSYKTASG